MSKQRVAVLEVVSGQLSVTAAAAECRISRGHLHRLLRRYREDGLDGLEPRSRQPHTSPHGTPGAVRDRITTLRTELTGRGLDAGPATIAWHLGREGLPVPATSTIRRILHAAGLVTPEPYKRPRSSWIRFEAAAPNGRGLKRPADHMCRICCQGTAGPPPGRTADLPLRGHVISMPADS